MNSNVMPISEVRNFGNLPCEFYVDSNGERYISRKKIGEALEYSDPNRAIEKIHKRYSDRLDRFSTVVTLGTVEGDREISRDTIVYSLRGAMEICRWSRQPKANAFMDFCWSVIESYIRTDDVYERIEKIENLLKQSGILKPFINPRYTFENLVTRFKQATGIDRVRSFYDIIGDWYGIKVPYSNTINIPVRDWILLHVPMEAIQELVVGFETKMITYSDQGFPVSRNGIFGNSVEWEKVKREFNNSCAYCGRTDVPLIPEHIIPQSVLSKKHPERVDLIGNIVPACKECNHSKLRNHMQTWYRQQPFFSDERYWNITEHIEKYEVA